MTIYKQVLGCLFALLPLSAEAQVGEFRKDFAIGVNGGYLSGFYAQCASGYVGWCYVWCHRPLYV